MNYTGVKATEEEKAEMLELLKTAQSTPVILLGGVDVAGRAVDDMLKRTHEIAMSHGLPEVEGYYGCDLRTGEFVSA
jgi:hypothetical protein